VLVGAHVRAGPGFSLALSHGDEVGADAIQVFTQSPRGWKPSPFSGDVLSRFRESLASHATIRRVFCHATYLINLATSDESLYARSLDCLLDNLRVAREIGASGLVLHAGSHRGEGFESCVERVASGCRKVLDAAQAGTACPILLENTAGAGGTVGRSFTELARLIEAAGRDERLGVCLDTQHLWASGVAYRDADEAHAAVEAFDEVLGLGRLRCIHGNDSKVPLGSGRDRHANIGEGTIGGAALGWLLGHPSIQESTVLLEVPGAGKGPRREDVAAMRRVHAEGLASWAAR